MANYTSTSGSYTTRLTVTETATSTADNMSTVSFSLTLIKNSGTGLWNSNSCSYSININGTSYSGTFTYDFRDYSSLTLKSTTTQTVTHDSDGSKSIAVSASVDMDNEPYVYTMSPSGTLALTTIPRASDVTVSNYSITNTTGSISATITSKANFYHKWRWKLGSGSWSAWSNKGAINNTTSTVTVANTTLLAQLPTATSASFNIQVATYSDSGYANQVGTKSATATVSVNTSNIKPSVSLGNISMNSTPISGYAVAGYSKVQSAFTTTNSSGASSATTYFTVSTGSLATTSSTSTSGTVVSNVVPSSTSNYTLTIYAYAKDSRGATSSTVSKAVTVYGYQPPTATLSAYRTSSSSSTSEDGAGTYAYVTFSGAVRSSVNSQNSVQSTTCTYSGSISGTATSGGHYALADTQTVTFNLTVTDKVTSSTASVTIAKASYPLDLYDDGSGNVGVGLGTIAESNLLKSALSMDINADQGRVEIYQSTHKGRMQVGWGATRTRHGMYSYGYATDEDTFVSNGKWLIVREADGSVAMNGNATSATDATNATYVDILTTNETSNVNGFLPFVTSTSGKIRVRANDGTKIITRQGTTSNTGIALLRLGNTTSAGTAGNKYGLLDLYPQTGAYYGRLVTIDTLTANRTYTLPNATGTVLVDHFVADTTSIITRTSGLTVASGSAVTSLAGTRLCMLYFALTGNQTNTAGSNAFVGTLKSDYKPRYPIHDITYYGGTAFACYIDTSGNITVRTLIEGTNITTDTINFTFTYFHA